MGNPFDVDLESLKKGERVNGIQGYINLHGKKKKLALSESKQAFPVPGGGDKRDRTADLLNAIQKKPLNHGVF